MSLKVEAVVAPNGKVYHKCDGKVGGVVVSTIGFYRYVAIEKALRAIFEPWKR